MEEVSVWVALGPLFLLFSGLILSLILNILIDKKIILRDLH